MEDAAERGSNAPYNDADTARNASGTYANAQNPSHSDLRRAAVKPSALQVSVTATAINDQAQGNVKNPRSPTIFRTFGDNTQSTPRLPRSHHVPDVESPKSPRERLDEFLKQEDPGTTEDSQREEAIKPRNTSTSPSKVQSYNQLRNLSSPLPDIRPLGHSSPPSPRSTASPPLIGSSLRPEGRQAPRTSSIDSAISSISAMTQSPHGSQDSGTTASTEVSNLIRTAGSAENLIQHLLREKQQTDARCSQLWTMVEKQRRMLFGLKQDLDRAARDKERYWKRLQEYRDFVPPLPDVKPETQKARSRDASQSPAISDDSSDLPLQRQSSEIARSGTGLRDETRDSRPLRSEQPGNSADAIAVAPPPDPSSDLPAKHSASALGSNHSHKHTSSSDIGIFNLQKSIREIPPLQTHDLNHSRKRAEQDSPSQLSPLSRPGMPPTTSFTAKRLQPTSAKPFNGPALTLTESTPPGNDVERMTPPRKAPPAPLDLGQVKHETGSPLGKVVHDDSASEYEDDIEADELLVFERGRKKTREADDREREVLQQKEQEERSRSQKQKSSKSRSGSKKKMMDDGTSIRSRAVPMPPSIKALAPEPTPAITSSFLSEPASIAGMLSPMISYPSSDIKEQAVATKPPMSPGLPLSPRPSDRPQNAPAPRLPRETAAPVVSPPLSPRPGFVGLPLSPRAPRQPIPLPPSTPMSMAPSSPMPPAPAAGVELFQPTRDAPSPTGSHAPSDQALVDGDSARSTDQMSTTSKPRGIFKGFVSEAYPGLLIPPNALPSIKITVVSSRLKPSRHSLVLKGADEEPVFTLGVSARFDRRNLWQVEKAILSLHHLDQQLRQSFKLDVKPPDRSLFSGHAPAKVDSRRIALERYFETILDTQMDEKAALTLCHYLSTNASEPGNNDTNGGAHVASPTVPPSDGPTVKGGFLTKRGKNFGGWKARFFVLDEPILRYYEAPRGTLLGTIKLNRARIGRQSPPKPSGSGDEGDGQYRHAFLIREPKRKDPNSFTDHVLCAESDQERDAWVSALMGYINSPDPDNGARPPLEKNHSGSSRTTHLAQKTTLRNSDLTKESPDSEDFDGLQAVPYEDTQPAQAPHVRITPDVRSEESPSPTTPGSQPSDKAPSVVSKPISGPQNGAKISDAGAWGNKPLSSPLPVQKEHKKRSLFGFHNKDTSHLASFHPNGSDLSLTQQQYQEQITNVKAVWGASLADAVEYCPPKGVADVCLPAVVYRCLKFLEFKNASSEEGIFRMSGSNTLIKNLKAKFIAEGDFDMLASGQWYDIHAVASLLKLYLRELPSPLLTKELQMDFLSVLEIRDERHKQMAYNTLIHRLPKPDFHLLRALSAFLVTVVNNSDINKMDTRNVGIVFAPTLNIPTPVILMFLTEFDLIFGDPIDGRNIPALESSASQTLAVDDIRSPRKQMFSDLPTPAYNQTSFASNQHESGQGRATNGIQVQQDLGFTPLQPTYQSTNFTRQPRPEDPNSVTGPGPEYAVARPRNLAPGGSAKQSRRESSMFLMSGGQRKGSLSMMRTQQGTTEEHSEFA